MLSIQFGKTDGLIYGPIWFKHNYEPSWFADEFIQEMIREVDKTAYIGGSAFSSPFLGVIPPERLSGGVKTLIVIYKRPDKTFDATSCGPNCARMLLELGKRENITVGLRYLLPLDGLEPFEVEIANTGHIVRNAREYSLEALDCLDEAES